MEVQWFYQWLWWTNTELFSDSYMERDHFLSSWETGTVSFCVGVKLAQLALLTTAQLITFLSVLAAPLMCIWEYMMSQFHVSLTNVYSTSKNLVKWISSLVTRHITALTVVPPSLCRLTFHIVRSVRWVLGNWTQSYTELINFTHNFNIITITYSDFL